MKLTRLFLLSGLLNVLLGIGVVFLLHSRSPRRLSNSTLLEHAPSQSKVPASPELSGGEHDGNGFRWGQIESTDYQRFIQNLRSVDCPEQTIRDIVVSEIGRLYDGKVAQSTGTEGQAGRLREEEKRVLEALLGPSFGDIAVSHRTAPEVPLAKPVAATQAGGALVDAGKDADRMQVLQNMLVKTPLALMEPDPDLQWTDRKRASLERIRQQFAITMEQCGAAPNTIEYLRYWEEAQRGADISYSGLLGQESFRRMQEKREQMEPGSRE